MEVDKMKCEQIKSELSKRNLDTSGKKAELVNRLKEAIHNERGMSPSSDSGKPEKASSVDSSKRKSSDESGSEEDHTNKRTKSSDWAQEDDSLERTKSDEQQPNQNQSTQSSINLATTTYYPAADSSLDQSQQSQALQQQQQQSQQQQYNDPYAQYYYAQYPTAPVPTAVPQIPIIPPHSQPIPPPPQQQQQQQQVSQQQQQHSSQPSSSSSSTTTPTPTSIEYAEPIPNNPIPDDKRKVFVGGLNNSITEYQIKQVLDAYGPIENIQLIRDNITGISKGYAFVLFTSDEPANRLINIQSIDICGKPATLRPLTDKNSIKIFVGGISSLSEDDIREYFNQYCTVLEVTLIKDQVSQKPKGYGFVALSDRKKGEEIINEGKVQIKGIYVNVGNATKRNNNNNSNNSNNNMNNMGNNNMYHSIYGMMPGIGGGIAIPTVYGANGVTGSNMMMMNNGYYPYSYSYPYYGYPTPAMPPSASTPDSSNANGYVGYYGYGTK